MEARLTFQQQQAIKPLPENYELKFNSLQDSVIKNSLKPLIGIALYKTIENGHEDIWNGNDFTYCNEEIEHYGLNYVLAYLIYGEYALNSYAQDTWTGIRSFNQTESNRVDFKELERISKDANIVALNAFELTKKYMKTLSLYPEKVYRRARIEGVRK